MLQYEAGTTLGLAKMPYIRDTRRAQRGINGFQLLKPDLAQPVHFPDTVAIGHYPVDTHYSACSGKIPDYMSNTTINPYYIPFRALTVNGAPNMLVSGECSKKLTKKKKKKQQQQKKKTQKQKQKQKKKND